MRIRPVHHDGHGFEKTMRKDANKGSNGGAGGLGARRMSVKESLMDTEQKERRKEEDQANEG